MSPKTQGNILKLKSIFSDGGLQPVTRFAPSPTGALHLGHVAAALHVWGIGRCLKARIYLRMEDHDTGRCRKEFEDGILRDLDWLGLEPHDGVSSAYSASNFRQSDHWQRYFAAVHDLESTGQHVYACSCSRRDIQAAITVDAGDEIHYAGTCRHRQLEPAAGLGLRLLIPDDKVAFTDVLQGDQEQTPGEQCGDVLLRDRDGNWTYQFAVTVDDMADGINLVIRGDDLLDSTGRQIMMADMLGRKAPAVFAHHDLIVDADGRKLSKRDAAAGISRLRGEGYHPQQVLAMAARQVGLVGERHRLSVEDLRGLFLDEW